MNDESILDLGKWANDILIESTKERINSIPEEEKELRSKLEAVYNEAINIAYSTNKRITNHIDFAGGLAKRASLEIDKKLIEKEMDNMTNVINSVRKYYMLHGKPPFAFYIEFLLTKEAAIVIDTFYGLNENKDTLRDRGVIDDVTIPNSWRSIQIGSVFISQLEVSHKVDFIKPFRLVLRVKSLEQITTPIQVLNKLIENDILTLYINGELTKVCEYKGD